MCQLIISFVKKRDEAGERGVVCLWGNAILNRVIEEGSFR